MNFLGILIGEIGLVALIASGLWFLLKRSADHREIRMRDAYLSKEDLETHAKKTAMEHSVEKRRNPSKWPIMRLNKNYEFILSVYNDLNRDIQKRKTVPACAEWLLDNFYKIEEQVKELRRDYDKKSYARLPVLKAGPLAGYARVFAVVADLVAHTDGKVDESSLSNYLKAYQSQNVLLDREINAIPMVLKFALIENIKILCENISDTLRHWHESDEIFHDWLSEEDEGEERSSKFLRESLKNADCTESSFVEHLIYHLRISGKSYAPALKTIEELLSRFGETSEHMAQLEHDVQSINTISMSNSITSLILFSTLNWDELIDSCSAVEQILGNDPDGTYPLMDHCTRGMYRRRVEALSIKYGVSELHVAKKAVDLAKDAFKNNRADLKTDNSIKRTWHAGYYLLGDGLSSLEKSQDNQERKPSPFFRKCRYFPPFIYIGSISLITLLNMSFFIIVADLNFLSSLLLGLLLLFPCSEVASQFINMIVCKTMKPAEFPRLELKDGIPENMSAIVAMPTLFADEKQVKEMLARLEGQYLTNREDNLYFAIISAFKDSDSPVVANSEAIINTALKGIEELNRKYPSDVDKFYLFHRALQYNKSNNKWIGWERKRGAIIEFNDFVLGSDNTSFEYFSCKNPQFSKVKYIITLDSDTILPFGMAKKMISTMAHPLNWPVVDENKGVVVSGYGILQPRVIVGVESANSTAFSRIFTGQGGIDPYANAISDVYQDLFGEAIYTGKGIYDLRVFQRVLKNSLPDNAILSHDLLEGSFVRTGLVSDISLVDSTPSTYNSYMARLYRWVRGDWQLFPFIFGKICRCYSSKLRNPLNLLSRWKMLDNLRRSLFSPAMMILAAINLFVLPGSVYFWVGFFVFSLMFPFIIPAVCYLCSGRVKVGKTKNYIPVIDGAKAGIIQILLALSFLPHQAWLMSKAMFVTLTRVFVTRKNLLEWTTSADVERNQKNTLTSYISRMKSSLIITPIILALTIFYRPSSIFVSLLFCIAWSASPFAAYYISREKKERKLNLSENDTIELGRITRKTWRYFEEFINDKGNYLAPDNYQEDPPRGIAYRTSPTNIGMGLLSILSARDFGYIGTYEMVDLIDKTVSTIEGLEKEYGHLYNWYETSTLKPMEPRYISTVDSGNLLGSLITLKQGLNDYLNTALTDVRFIKGFADTLFCAGKDGEDFYHSHSILQNLDGISAADLLIWNGFLKDIINNNGLKTIRDIAWKAKLEKMAQMLRFEIKHFMPWLDTLEEIPQVLSENTNEDIKDILNALIKTLTGNITPNNLVSVCKTAKTHLERLIELISKFDTKQSTEILAWTSKLNHILNKAEKNTKIFLENYQCLINRINMLSDNMDFLPLYDTKRQLFSIGFNAEEKKLTNSYYDLLASEARLTSYICIARGTIPSTHWARMGRSLTTLDSYKGLVSWTGTMFEYLMPLLFIKSYRNTLLDETYSFVIRSQKKYGRQRKMPWGSSESQFSTLDINQDYQYKAIGIPWLGLKRGLIEDAVTSPYATILALMVDPRSALKNIKYLLSEGLEGPYGLYEAADYTPERLIFDNKRTLIKSFMAHHQGMSLLALDNFINEGIMQNRFDSVPENHSARLLLHEKVPARMVIVNESKEKVIPYNDVNYRNTNYVHKYYCPDPVLPKAHILSNGYYSVMITDRGTGYSKNKMVSISRWREDSTLDPYGIFFYFRNVETNAAWSSAYSPFNDLPDQYEVVFTADKAAFTAVKDQVQTKTEVIVTSGDNVEIRRVSLKNMGDEPCTIEVTSYFEVVLAPQNTDVAHPAFSNLFVETYYDPSLNSVFASRRPRGESDINWIASESVVVKGEIIGDLQFETDRMQFLGRGNNMKSPNVMKPGKPLSGTKGFILDPIISMRLRVKIEPNETAQISFLISVGDSEDTLISLIEKYSAVSAVERAFDLARLRSQAEMKYLNLDVSEIELYQELMSHILFVSPTKRIHEAYLLKNKEGQSALWKYGISGDLPIVLITLKDLDQVKILYDALKAHEFWQMKDLKVDLVVLDEEENSYLLPLQKLVNEIIRSRRGYDLQNTPGSVFILNRNNMQEEDIRLLYKVARVVLNGEEDINKQLIIPLKDELPKLRGATTAEEKCFVPITLEEQPMWFFNGIGGFSVDGDKYIIKLKSGQNTPAPWVNVIANQKFGSIITESGSGYTWYGNSREFKVTPWSNDAVSDSPGETLYLCDVETNRKWTITPLPIREDEPYTITHGFGYTSFEHISNGISQRLTQFVPEEDSIKVNIVSLTNTSGRRRSLSLTYYIRPVLGVSDQGTALHITTNLNASGTLFMRNNYNDEFNGAVCFADVSRPERTVTGDRKEFFGNGGISSPDCLNRESLSGTVGTCYDPCGAIQVQITLEPGEVSELVFLLGVADNEEKAKRLIQNYRDAGAAKEALALVEDSWKKKTRIIQVDTPIDEADIIMNGWLQYQTISCRLWARSGFYQSGGAFGFRDQLQDSLAVAYSCPEITRAQILLHAARQFKEGDVQHWWHEPQGKGIRTRCSDDLLWLPYSVAEYIRISGDTGILKEKIAFIESPRLTDNEFERYEKPSMSNETATLFEHCLRAIEASLETGEHGLPLIGTCDWNDGLNTVGKEGRGESVWLGWFLASVLKMFSPICKSMGCEEKAEEYLEIKSQLIESIEKNAWDGYWYRRAYFDNGKPLGSVQNDDCKIDSIAQTWAVISGEGDPRRAVQAMNSLDDHLVDREKGIIKLLAPPFDKGVLSPGYIKGYVPGIRENGGQYTHAAVWAVIAYAILGDGDKAWELFDMIIPINHSNNKRECFRYKVEPYVLAADVYSEDMHAGRGGWSWYTGSAGWAYRAGLEYLLGFQKHGDEIIMDPCIPAKMDEYIIGYKYKDSLYSIVVKNPQGISKGVLRLSVDGSVSEGNKFSLKNDGKVHNVEVQMGTELKC